MTFRKRFLRRLLGGACAVVIAAAGAARGATTELDNSYQAVLDAMKSPAVKGVLITEIGPESAAGKAGALGGDVITSYAGRNITDLQSLREGVAEVLASREVEGVNSKLLLGVRRGPKDMVLQIEAAPLGIRAIEVEAGVAAPLNPPASGRGTIALKWPEAAGGDSGVEYLRTSDPATHTGLGWQERSVSGVSDGLSVRVVVVHLDAAETAGAMAVASTETLTCRLRVGDFKTSPAFVLDEVDVKTEADYQTVTTTATRAGGNLEVETEIRAAERNYAPVKSEHGLPLDALPSPVLAVAAAAIAGEKDAVLPLTLLSVRDYVARPGYVLVVKSDEKIAESDRPAMRVDLMHCGISVEKYYFGPQRELLRIDVGGGTGITSVRTASQEAAELPLGKKPTAATQPK